MALIVGFESAAIVALFASAAVAQGMDQSKVADPCALPPGGVAAALAQAPGWSLLRLTDLQSGDRTLWNATRPNACPGFTSGRLGVGSSTAYALALLRKTQQGTEEKVLLLIPDGGRVQEHLLATPHTVSNPAVVWRVGPGTTRVWDGGHTIYVPHDSIIVETLETTAEQFYLVHGRVKSVVTSD